MEPSRPTGLSAKRFSVTYDSAGGYYVVSGTHTYATSGDDGGVGQYATSVHISDALPVGSASSVSPSQSTSTNVADVTDNPILVIDILKPVSDTGKRNIDVITNM